MEAIATIDLGSTSLKAMIFDLDGRCLATASRPTERSNPYAEVHPEWVFLDPDQIWGGAADACREAVAQLADPHSIRAVSVTGMGMTGLPVAADGTALYPFISWQDPRPAPKPTGGSGPSAPSAPFPSRACRPGR